MKGTMLIYDPTGTEPRRVEFSKAPTLEEIQAGVGGFIEAVPHFDRMRIDGKWRKVAAYCNEEGKLDELPINKQATMLWEAILANQSVKLRDEKGRYTDVLVGPIVVLYGDDEFMEAI